jgi:hypothetical protein
MIFFQLFLFYIILLPTIWMHFSLLEFQNIDTAILISTMASLATVFTAIISYKTVSEMKRSREISYLPNVVLPRKKTYYVRWDENSINPLNFRVYTDSNSEFKVDEFINYQICDIFNIGLGIAQNIEIEWVYDCQELIKTIQSQTEISGITCRKYDGNLVSFMYSREIPVNLHFNNTFVERLDYIIPIHLENDKNLIKVPSDFFYIYILCIYANICNISFLGPSSNQKIYLSINYENIERKQNKKNYTLLIHSELFNRTEGLIFGMKVILDFQLNSLSN